jgi:hypothetical protein
MWKDEDALTFVVFFDVVVGDALLLDDFDSVFVG